MAQRISLWVILLISLMQPGLCQRLILAIGDPQTSKTIFGLNDVVQIVVLNPGPKNVTLDVSIQPEVGPNEHLTLERWSGLEWLSVIRPFGESRKRPVTLKGGDEVIRKWPTRWGGSGRFRLSLKPSAKVESNIIEFEVGSTEAPADQALDMAKLVEIQTTALKRDHPQLLTVKLFYNLNSIASAKLELVAYGFSTDGCSGGAKPSQLGSDTAIVKRGSGSVAMKVTANLKREASVGLAINIWSDLGVKVFSANTFPKQCWSVIGK